MTKVPRAIESLAYGSVWLLVFMIPWEQMLQVDQSRSVSQLVGIAVLLVGAVGVVATRSARTVQHEPFIPLAAFVAWGALSLLWTVNTYLTQARLLTTLQTVALVWLVWQYAPTTPKILGLMAAYVVGALMACGGTLWVFSRGLMLQYARFAPEGFDPNDLALVLSLGIPPAMWLLALRVHGPARLIYALFVPTAAFAILLTGSRMGLGTMAIGLTFAGIAIARRSRRMAMALGVGVMAAGALAVVIVPTVIWERLNTTLSEVGSGTLSDRTGLWKSAIQLFCDHWALGIGSGAFITAVTRFTTQPLLAHNTFLSVLAEQGGIGFILFVAFLFTVFYRVWNRSGVQARLFWASWICVWLVGANMLTWEHRKPTWVVLSLALSWAYRDLRRAEAGVTAVGPTWQGRPRGLLSIQARGAAPMSYPPAAHPR